MNPNDVYQRQSLMHICFRAFMLYSTVQIQTDTLVMPNQPNIVVDYQRNTGVVIDVA